MSDTVPTTVNARDLRRPVQERSAVRITRVLEAAERMLEEAGPEKTSIPALADSAGVPRAAIYPFFPDKYAVFSHLARIHMGRLREALSSSKAERATSWQTWVEVVIKSTTDYYNANPVASILLLRGSFTDDDHDAHAAKNETIGSLLRAKAVSLAQLPNLPTRPDAAAIAVELAFACMKYGYLHERKISPAICREATYAVVAYLQKWDAAV